MPPLEPRDHRISLADAAAHTKRHRGAIQGRAAAGDHAGAFHADQVMAILKQAGCSALRIYHGRDEKGQRSAILVGVDGKGADMVGPSNMVLEEWYPCPPFCDPDSPLLR